VVAKAGEALAMDKRMIEITHLSFRVPLLD
jgi:hypothetical protein